MTKKKLKDHIHKYKRHKYSTGTEIFFCTNGSCTHKIEVALALGKPCLCNVCGKEFNLDEYSIRQVKPRCKSCRKHKGVEIGASDSTSTKPKINSASELLERLRAAVSKDSGDVLDEPNGLHAGDKDLL